MKLKHLLDRLRKQVGAPKPPSITDPFQQVLLEQVAYLASDEKRPAAFMLALANESGHQIYRDQQNTPIVANSEHAPLDW